MRDKILPKAIELFSIYGFRAISMDRLSKEVGCSTKTLYKFFPDKAAILKIMVEIGVERDRASFDNLEKLNKPALEKLLIRYGHFFERHNSNLYPGFLDDLKKIHPEIYSLIDNFLENYSKKWLQKKLNVGIKEGFFRKNIEIEILATFLIEFSMMSLSTVKFPSHKFSQGAVFATIVQNFLYGISTKKGVAYLDKNFKKHFKIK